MEKKMIIFSFRCDVKSKSNVYCIKYQCQGKSNCSVYTYIVHIPLKTLEITEKVIIYRTI